MRSSFLTLAAASGLVLASCALLEGDGGKNSGLVARKDFDAAKDWTPKKFMGRDFWHVLGVSQDTHPAKGNWAGTHMRELVGKPLFKEAAINYGCVRDMTVPGSDKVAISAMDAPRYLELIESRPETPFFLMPGGTRPVFKLTKKFEHDMDGYNKWKKDHPNFMACVEGEIDNDFLSAAPWGGYHWPAVKKRLENDKQLVESIEKEYPKPKNREELAASYMKACKSFRDYFFNDAAKTSFMRAAHCHDHYFYESGSTLNWLETTNTGSPDGLVNYRHQVSLYFSRGAARQYDQGWAWYIAVFHNGYDDKGKFSGNSTPNYRLPAANVSDAGGGDGPGHGMSPSLLTRDMYLAYLGGANFVQHESWWGYLSESTKDARKTWGLDSPFGKAWEEWFDFTKKNPDRGASYAPVALLVPFEQGYPNYGGKSWQMFEYERPDWMIDAFMFTIMPHSPVTKAGDEGALANSPHGDIYDVIVPNTPKGPVSLDTLSSYKVAVMLGKYPKSKAMAERMREYVRAGGTLLINISQANEYFTPDFLGVERAATPVTRQVDGPVRWPADGKTFALADAYEAEAVRLAGATPLLEDSAGTVLACKKSFGKGSVIVTTVDCLVPKTPEKKDGYFMTHMVYNKKFPFVESLLGKITDEVLPLEVRGDVQYGLNKLADGWIVYLINNKGVKKFTNKPQELDMSNAARVEVALKDIKPSSIMELRGRQAVKWDDTTNSFSVEVPPGEVKIMRITSKK